MALARSSFGQRGASAAAGAVRRPRSQGRARQDGAAPVAPDASPLALLFSAKDFDLEDFHTQPAAWICGGIIALLVMAVVLLFGFGFATLMRAHNVLAETISNFTLFAAAGLAVWGAVYGGALMAAEGKRRHLRFALLVLVFAVELLLLLLGEVTGKAKGVSWLLFGALIGGVALWAKLKYDGLVAHDADMGAGLDVNSV